MPLLLVLLLTLGTLAEGKPLVITGDVPASSPIYDYLDRLEAYGCALPTFRALRPLPYGNLFHTIPNLKPSQSEDSGEPPEQPPPDPCAAPGWLMKMRDLIRRGSLPVQLKEDLYLTHDDLVPLVGIEAATNALYPLREGRQFFNGANLYSELSVILGAGRDFGVAIGGNPIFLAALDDYQHLDGRFFMQEAYFKLAYRRLEVEYGRFSQRFGEAKHGSLILAGAAKPMTTAKVALRPHTILPLAFLGQVSLEAWFASEGPSNGVDDARYFGVQGGLRPTGWLELSFSNLNQYGGAGRPPVSGSDLARMAIFSGATDLDAKRHRGYAFNIGIWGPSSFVKAYAQLYLEGFGADVSPLAGLYFPKLGEWDLRFEYVAPKAGAYTSPIWTQGFTTQVTPLGHPIGPDGEAFYLDIGTPDIDEWRPTLTGFYETRMKHPLTGFATERRIGGGIEINKRWEQTELGASFRYANIEHPQYLSGVEQTGVAAGTATLRYNFY